MNDENIKQSAKTKDSEAKFIVERFFKVLEFLKASKEIRGLKTFCDLYDINRRNLIFCKTNPESGMFKLTWLAILIKEYNVSSEWLMTGYGEMFVRK